MASKLRACEIHAASLVRAASGEFCEGRSPAKNRAVSSAVAVSEQLARAAAKTTVKVIRMVAIIRVAATDTVALRTPIHSIEATSGSSRQNCGGVSFLVRQAQRQCSSVSLCDPGARAITGRRLL